MTSNANMTRFASVRRAVFLTATLTLFSMTSAAEASHNEHKAEPELHVAGSAEVRMEPDLAQVRLGVTEEASDAGEAQGAVNRVANAILEAVTGLGIDKAEIQTSRLTLHPVYDHSERRKPRVIGFRASNTVSIRVHDLTLLGPVIDQAVGAGANEVQGVQFLLDDDEAARLQALQDAVAEAKAKAEAMAEALGQPLGRVLRASEGSAQVHRPVYQEAVMMRATVADSSTPVAQGKVTVSAQVSLVYTLGD